ncbi:MAG: TIR domain-containing protein [Ruminococcus sp.]|nr:TIR domain-containing protein [Ruminococcus sp.]
MRDYLKTGTWIRLPDGECYKITGIPVGEGGGGLIYPAVRLHHLSDGSYKSSELDFAIKECFPLSSEHRFMRSETGEIISSTGSEESMRYLNAARHMQLQEAATTAKIYKTGFRLTPVLNGFSEIELSFDDGDSFHPVNNTVTIMESLSDKGTSLKSHLKRYHHLPAVLSFRIIEQVLFAVKEIHTAGYLHLDIQDGNVFIKGSLSDRSDFASLIDFGCSRKMQDDQKCAPVLDKTIFSTQGYGAPEISHRNDGNLRLGPEADLYSIGYLLLLLLTGERYSSYELYSNNDGQYLTRFKLRRIACPKHLIPKMQAILGRALENEPEDRYHSCDEMLADVSDLLEALQPYRSDLSSVAYDAFICYKHGDIDSLTAKALQKKLEHFRAPYFSGERNKKIHRIFVDEGELSSCSDFGLQIREALKNSGWLIVICSPETKSSPWVNLEIKTFLEFHDRSRILAVMTEGEPEDIFPDALSGSKGGINEVLAADARGNDLKQILKKLNKDAFLKIAAPILGTTYDSLKQRQRTYFFQRAALTAGIAAIFLSAFTAYSLWQAGQIREQYQLARQNQARYLSDLSLDLFASGDKQAALLTALAVAPEDKNNAPVVPEQMYALNTALSPYSPGTYADYYPAYIGEAEAVTRCLLSPEGSYVLALDTYGHVSFLSGDSGKCLWSATPEDFQTEAFIHSIPVSENEALLMSSQEIFLVDLDTKEISGTLTTSYSPPQDESSYAFANNLLAVNNGTLIYIYNIEDFSLIDTVDLTIHFSDSQTHINTMAFQEDGTYLSAGLSEQTVLYSLEDQTLTSISDTGASTVLFTDRSHLAVIHYSSLVSGAEVSDIWGGQSNSYYLTVYDIENGTVQYESPIFTMPYSNSAGLRVGKLDEKENRTLFCWMQNNLLVIDLNTMETISEATFLSSINNVFSYDSSRCIVGLNEGYVQVLSFSDNLSRYQILSLSDTVNTFYFNSKYDTLIQLHGQKLTFSNSHGNPDMMTISATDLLSSEYSIITDVSYYNTEVSDYRCIKLSDKSAYDTTALVVQDAISNETVFQYQAEENGLLFNVGIGEMDGIPYLCYAESISDKDTVFYKVDLATGDTLLQENVTDYTTSYFKYNGCIIYSPDMSWFFIEESAGAALFRVSDNELVREKLLLEDMTIEEMALTADYEYLILTALDGNYDTCIYIYNIEKDSLTEAELSYDTSSVEMITGQSQSVFAVYDGNGQIDVFDCSSGECLQNLELTTSSFYDFIFFDDDNCLITLTDYTIAMWDINAGKISMQYSLEQNYPFGRLITAADSDYFILKDPSFSESTLTDRGQNTQSAYLFYSDSPGQFYPFAEIKHGNVDLNTMQAYIHSRSLLSYVDIYEYSELAGMAEEVLDGRTLSEAEKREYFITE